MSIPGNLQGSWAKLEDLMGTVYFCISCHITLAAFLVLHLQCLYDGPE